MELLDWKAAAQYCGLKNDTRYLKGLVQDGRGPAYVQPSPRKIYFTAESLDAWMKTWPTSS